MRCTRCRSVECRVLDTRFSESTQTTRRRYECAACGRRFSTYEIHTAAMGGAKRLVRAHAATLRRRWALRARDMAIADALHLGWRPLCEKYGLTKTSVYLAAKRGRDAKKPVRQLV